MQILSRRRMLELVEREPNQHSVLAICEWGSRNQVESIRDKSDCLILEFDDTTFEKDELSPRREHVEEALAWAKTRDINNMVVACAAGISRSSAMAFLILCQEMDPSDAFLIWELGEHHPNELILHYGVEVLGDHIRPQIRSFLESDAKRQGLKLEWVTRFFK